MSDIKLYEDKMVKTIDALEEEYTTIRAGRANPHILDKIKVDYYGTPTCLLYTSPSPRDGATSRMPSSA